MLKETNYLVLLYYFQNAIDKAEQMCYYIIAVCKMCCYSKGSKLKHIIVLPFGTGIRFTYVLVKKMKEESDYDN